MKKTYSLIAIIACLLLAPDLLYSQTAVMQEFKELRNNIVEKQKNTRAEIERLNKQIQQFEQRLQQAEEKYEALYQKYQNLKQLIALQDEKLSQLRQEQSQIQEEITITTESLKAKRAELERLIENYKQTLSYLYKHGRTSQLALIFSASSVNQMLIRSFYLEKFNNYREQQAQEIRQAEKELEQTKEQLVKAQEKNEEVLAEIKEEKQTLAQKKEQQEKNVALLRENREEINKKLNQVQQQKDNLNSTLSDLIRREEEIREAQEQKLRQLEAERQEKLAAAKKIENDAKREAEIEKYSEPIKLDNFLDSNKMEEIENRFASNKGELPWPVDSRTIAEHFGNKVHPVYGTKTPNLGVEIVTDAQSSVEVVHDGYVLDVRPVPGYGDVIFVKHGRFITAYGNLSEVMVSKNEVLYQGDMLGLSGDASSPKGESLFFLIRENNENLNPENWLRRETMSSNY
ncbi:murein hydrolase activator EnvC family protein [Fodinibius sp.]|uniref:murein hydrolase activator EnvC family protein n=1 Tax=Fodinibius sp. TaxID=1872440 RepID=UPI002ACDEE99|nr:peptidoglycan DD-metalloendopeptidase family protein [Fodinibius sp.]MDZ7658677.1 peptidoglycan DD-metalloendopeptidase family protein [Fodinibius sp.]